MVTFIPPVVLQDFQSYNVRSGNALPACCFAGATEQSVDGYSHVPNFQRSGCSCTAIKTQLTISEIVELLPHRYTYGCLTLRIEDVLTSFSHLSPQGPILFVAKVPNMETLPNELISQIFECLELGDLLEVLLVSKRFGEIATPILYQACAVYGHDQVFPLLGTFADKPAVASGQAVVSPNLAR